MDNTEIQEVMEVKLEKDMVLKTSDSCYKEKGYRKIVKILQVDETHVTYLSILLLKPKRGKVPEVKVLIPRKKKDELSKHFNCFWN